MRHVCLLSPTLFNVFLERIRTDALEEHFGTVSIGSRPITNLRFADDIDGLAGNECELASLMEKTGQSVEISAEKTKIMIITVYTICGITDDSKYHKELVFLIRIASGFLSVLSHVIEQHEEMKKNFLYAFHPTPKFQINS
ncbi:endonuclease-reverse transcriptase [Elysia marginata]|uniref:Endonuclease-reverse transcriptase n=1 Tax=Elysia marginata TaxID=1093978 RepID=A0AAV4EGT5_9GAST|nr:endonuclease-reverse transcriptase [Elysia marginata]